MAQGRQDTQLPTPTPGKNPYVIYKQTSTRQTHMMMMITARPAYSPVQRMRVRGIQVQVVEQLREHLHRQQAWWWCDGEHLLKCFDQQ